MEKEIKHSLNGLELYAPIPEGWELVGFRCPGPIDDWVGIATHGIQHGFCGDPRIIIRRKKVTKRFAVAKVELPEGMHPPEKNCFFLSGKNEQRYAECVWSVITEEVDA